MTGAEHPRDWHEWHTAYDAEGSTLSRRLAVVRGRLAEALDRRPPGSIRILSACAGQGRDVVPVLAAHRRRADARARLVELDPRNAEGARSAARRAGLAGVEVVEADAGRASAYASIVPAHILLFCGVFGNVVADDIESTVDALAGLCAPGATVIWTRGRTAPDLTPAIRRWFAERGFAERSFEGEPGSFGVGVHELAAEPAPYDARRRLFSFLPFEELAAGRCHDPESGPRRPAVSD